MRDKEGTSGGTVEERVRMRPERVLFRHQSITAKSNFSEMDGGAISGVRVCGGGKGGKQ